MCASQSECWIFDGEVLLDLEESQSFVKEDAGKKEREKEKREHLGQLDRLRELKPSR